MTKTRLAAILVLLSVSHAWISPYSAKGSLISRTRLYASPPNEDIKETLMTLIASTDRGRSTLTEEQRQELEEQFVLLESKCALKEPARSPLVQGEWTVQYTDCPPPSNGQLGPFKGIAQQRVDLESGSYQNLLRVPPNDWLSASLDASWAEWDGVLIEEADDPRDETDPSTSVQETKDEPASFLDTIISAFSPPSAEKSPMTDYGATCWVVTFEVLTIRLFRFPMVKNKFDNTRRVWRTTYVDEETRIVRAGRTGAMDDESVFYMTRAKENVVA